MRTVLQMDEAKVTKPLRALDISVCGHEVMRDRDVEIAIERRGILKGLAKMGKLASVAYVGNCSRCHQ
jgi:hypothetical protein